MPKNARTFLKSLILPLFYEAANGYNLCMAMTMTGTRIEVVPVQAERDEAEIAAAMACVFAILQSRSLEQQAAPEEKSSNWGYASRLEGVGNAEIMQSPIQTSAQSRSSWWTGKSGLCSLIAFLSFSVFFCQLQMLVS